MIIVLTKVEYMDAEKKARYARIKAQKETEDKLFYEENAQAFEDAKQNEIKKQKGDKA